MQQGVSPGGRARIHSRLSPTSSSPPWYPRTDTTPGIRAIAAAAPGARKLSVVNTLSPVVTHTSAVLRYCTIARFSPCVRSERAPPIATLP